MNDRLRLLFDQWTLNLLTVHSSREQHSQAGHRDPSGSRFEPEPGDKPCVGRSELWFR